MRLYKKLLFPFLMTWDQLTHSQQGFALGLLSSVVLGAIFESIIAYATGGWSEAFFFLLLVPMALCLSFLLHKSIRLFCDRSRGSGL